ncbi:UDP-N-acetylmuramyl tripeptide synthase [Eubacterium ruminantium]|uniref:Lipid II isoglutaminyl synthase (glutamine-hydrolyzing) subunit MurT n=1 Tax=Eubacterium ruminantium TaxID=42322 RepID=A0A1T4PHS4_9FIRM|nr:MULTISPECIES: MurT ligase domain-containing protein [Eubacterium]MCR5367828.1 MurT ligase domain-containing protein [Eubacterium sp.]SCW59905.1 UDP-N-acetylmuramyl tripeptide synthase [Eubacterium ruminantium]SDN10521.1 UDP-N-acetylmuramyl tripeptide synthase [Eubacterium ruminantium]SJZ90867.1 UDP-N-acetylmuramyl tripeptide synthase [Eubacterium ruminantium]
MSSKKSPKFYATLVGTKALIRGLKLARKNATHVPGNQALKVCPDFLEKIDKPKVVVGITGTNGKTTVSNLIDDVLADTKLQFIDNRFGGNIASGVVTAFVKNSDMKGRMKKQYAVLELDERMTTKIFPYVKPKILAVTNLFRDSYRRNAHSEYIFDILNQTIPKETRLVLNGEDPLSSHLCPGNKRVYFGIEDRSVYMDETNNIIRDMIACPECGTRLDYEYIRYNHIGKVKCPNCGFGSPAEFDYAVEKIDAENRRLYLRTPKGNFDIKLLGDNITDVYNQITAVAVLMEFGVAIKRITASFENMKIAGTRYDEMVEENVHLINYVAKGQNPVAVSRVCDFVRKEDGNKSVVLIIDDFFDRKETSENIAWFFDTDFEFLNDHSIKQIVIGGQRQYDLKLRLLLAGIPEDKILSIDDDVKTGELVDLNGIEKVFVLHDIYTTHFAQAVQKRLAERLRNGERNVSEKAAAYIKDYRKTFAPGKPILDPASKGKDKTIEVLFPEFCNLFGDSSNIKYLKACLPEAEFKFTSFTEKPYFADHDVDMIYLGAMTEKKQEMVINKLKEYKDALVRQKNEGTAILFTSNAVEVLGNYIENEDGSRIECLGLYDFSAKRDRMNRLNSLVRGHFGDLEIVGFKTQFTQATDVDEPLSFIEVDKGMGMDKDSYLEGIHDQNLFATYLVGPFLALNPKFTKYLMREVMGIDNAETAFKKEIDRAYKRRVKEFHDPKCEY